MLRRKDSDHNRAHSQGKLSQNRLTVNTNSDNKQNMTQIQETKSFSS